MDRALGAISTGTTAATTDQEAVNRFGMLYQWGRKDPFTPSSATINTEVQIYNATGNPITMPFVIGVPAALYICTS